MWSNRSNHRAIAALGGLLVAAVAAGCASGATPAPAGEATPEMIAEGQNVFQAGNCAACHGSMGQGGSLGPSLTDGSWIWLDAGSPTLQNDIVAITRDGVPEPQNYSAAMPPMGGANLSDAELQAVAAYILSLN